MYGNLLIVQQGHVSSALQYPSRVKHKSKNTHVSTGVYDLDVRTDVCLVPTY